MSKVVLFLFLSFVIGVLSHGRLVKPPPRGVYNPTKMTWQDNNPVSTPRPTNPASSAQDGDIEFVCRNDPPIPAESRPILTAGQPFPMQWSFGAAHVGDCYIYLSYDGALPDTQKKWFKIAEFGDCKSQNNIDVSITIPADLPSSSWSVLRWEWTALHVQPSSVELYCQCVDVAINGNPTGTLPGAPYMVSVPGNIPYAANMFRNEWANELWPVKKVGPPVYGSSTGTPATTGAPVTGAPATTGAYATTGAGTPSTTGPTLPNCTASANMGVYTSFPNPCIFPFLFLNEIHLNCLQGPNFAYCATKVDIQGKAVALGVCNPSCPVEKVPIFDNFEKEFLAVEYGNNLISSPKSGIDAGWTAFIILIVLVVVILASVAFYYFIVVPKKGEF